MGPRRRVVADFAAVLAVAVALTSGSTRSRIEAVVVDNFFSNRYDYRREWMRCIDMLTAPEAFVGAAQTSHPCRRRGRGQPRRRVVRASAGGCGVPVGRFAEHAGGDRADPARPSAGAAHSRTATGSSVLEEHARRGRLVRRNSARLAGCAAESFRQSDRLRRAGPVARAIQTGPEVFQLLRVVGREVASRVAEQRAVQILSQTRELREYSQRFAFVLHDIKNVSGQLSMLLPMPRFTRTIRNSSATCWRRCGPRWARSPAAVTPAGRPAGAQSRADRSGGAAEGHRRHNIALKFPRARKIASALKPPWAGKPGCGHGRGCDGSVQR